MPAKPTPNPGLARLAAAMRSERAAQGLRQRQAAERGGVAAITWSHIEVAKNPPRDFTLAGIDRGLGWSPGTAASILGGAGPPPPHTQAAPAPAPPPSANQLDRIEALLRRLVEQLEQGEPGGPR